MGFGTPLSLIGPVLAATVVLLLWFARGLVERRQKRNDILIGLHAEIIAGRYAVRLQTEKSSEARKNVNPFATSDRTDFVFESIKNDISVLPAIVIHDVVQYYRLAEQSNRMTDDLRDDVFQKQPDAEKWILLRDVLNVMNDQNVAAQARSTRSSGYAEVSLPAEIANQLRKKRGDQVLRKGELAQMGGSDRA